MKISVLYFPLKFPYGNHSRSFARGISWGIHWTMLLRRLKSLNGFYLPSKQGPTPFLHAIALLSFFLQLNYDAFPPSTSPLKPSTITSSLPAALCSFDLGVSCMLQCCCPHCHLVIPTYSAGLRLEAISIKGLFQI